MFIGLEGSLVVILLEFSFSVPEISVRVALVAAHGPASDQFESVSILTDERGTGEDGGTFTSGSWQRRDLNTIHGSNVNNWVMLSNNKFSLIEGHYFVSANARSYNSGNNQLRVFDVTNDAPLFYGENSTNNIAILKHHLTVASGWQTFQLEHRCSVTQADTGFGVANSFGGPEIYTQLKIQQL